jgi:KDO II ethanolaminephosphotransferase
MLVYISDHGESLGEKGNFFHGKPVKIAPKEQFSVPLVLWFSKPYLASKNSKKIIGNLKALSPDTPLRATHLFHSILGCAGITSDNGGIDENLDICSP